MGTSDRDLAWFLKRTPEPTAANRLPRSADDWSRQSVEAFITQRTGTIRAQHSHGTLRLHGAGVQEHAAELGQVGLITAAWQKAVSATGAALERVYTLRGALSAEITRRTTLLLSASPAAGSIVLHVEPQSAPMEEVEPEGNISMIDTPRPLADRASETLIKVLADFSTTNPVVDDGLATSLRELGPRVGSSLTNLAQAISRSRITIDASWVEPGAATVSASIDPAAAKRMRAFVAGRGLDAEEQTITGTLRTVSNAERWLVELPTGETERMGATELPAEEVEKWHVGAIVELRVRVALREQPDGNVRRTFTILSLAALDED